MPEQVKIIQRRLLFLNQRVLENTEHRWSECTGISGRNASESVVGMVRITQLCPQGDNNRGKSVHCVNPVHSFQAIGNRLATVHKLRKVTRSLSYHIE